MTRTDDELLALAARAGAINATAPWNPLTDDGDALRLAVKLGMLLDINRIANTVVARCGARGHLFCSEERMNGKSAAATRRAIVEVAAQIGGLL